MMSGNNGIRMFCPGPISQLPKDMVVEILVRISSVKSIVLCKSVCKYWRGLILDPRFAELHLARSKISILARNMEVKGTVRTVYLLEDEDGRCGFHSGHCICRPETEMERCEICRSDTTAITELKVPVVQKESMRGTTMSTCNGLLCLYTIFRVLPIVVCNPVTGEFVTLPDLDYHGCGLCGFGLDPKTGRYKVVMLYSLLKPNVNDRVLKAAVHVLGTDSWREADSMLGLGSTNLRFPALLNGALYWLYKEEIGNRYGVISFDLDSERLRYHSLPALPVYRMLIPQLNIAVLGGRLWVYRSFRRGKLDMCMVNELAVSDSSPKWISHCLSKVPFFLQPICSHDDGALLMLHGHPDNELIYYDPPQFSPRFKPLRFAGRGRVEVVAYTASFVSLKDIVRPGNTQVLNVYLRSENLVGDEDACSPSI